MPTLTQSQGTLESLTQEVKNHLVKQLEIWKMNIKQVAEVCFLLGHAQTVQGLEFLIDNLKNDFDVLAEMNDKKEALVDQTTDGIVQRYISHLIKTDPLKASEVGMLASKEGKTLENLIEKYPDLKNFI